MKSSKKNTKQSYVGLQAVIFLLLALIVTGVAFIRYYFVPAIYEPEPEYIEYIEYITDAVMTSAVEPAAQEDVPAPTPEPTPEPSPTPTPEPTPEIFTISAIGDLTLASHQNLSDASEYSYTSRLNGDYSYPFANTIKYFANDDLTIGNLECTFSDTKLYSYQTFYFRSPAAWANILTRNSIDFVTTANNHTMDFNQQGVDDTCAALDAVGAAYGVEGQAQLYTTESGLTVGIYTAYNNYNPSISAAEDAIAQLKADGAEYIICMYHWGQELHYRPNDNQVNLAHACIDAGANLVYGTHPHCLEPVEEYNGGLILYSMGNFSFGGNTNPSDWDTAIVQVKVKRDLDGTISNDGWTAIPCCCSEDREVNDYKPTPYDKDEEPEAYDRIMSKLFGTYEGADRTPDYSGWYASYS